MGNLGNRIFAIFFMNVKTRRVYKLNLHTREDSLSSGLNDVSNQRCDMATDLRDLCNAASTVRILTALWVRGGNQGERTAV